MRWEALFADLAAQLEQAEAAGLAAEVAERTRGETGRLTLADRLRPAVGHSLTLSVRGAGQLRGELTDVGRDWLLVREPAGGQLLIPLVAVLAVSGHGARSTGPVRQARAVTRVDLRMAARGLARDRTGVIVVAIDGSRVAGTLDRVGADYVEVAEHPPGEPRRAGAVRGVQAIALAAVGCIRSG